MKSKLIIVSLLAAAVMPVFAQTATISVDQVRQDNAQIRHDNSNVNYQKKEIAQDNAAINKDKNRIAADQNKLRKERAERNVDQRREDADIKNGDMQGAQVMEKKREQENREISGLKRNEEHAKNDASVKRADRHQEKKELHHAREKKSADVVKRNQDAANIK